MNKMNVNLDMLHAVRWVSSHVDSTDIIKRVKSNLHPPTCSKVRISTSNFKTGQLWPSNSRKSSTFKLLGGFVGEQ